MNSSALIEHATRLLKFANFLELRQQRFSHELEARRGRYQRLRDAATSEPGAPRPKA